MTLWRPLDGPTYLYRLFDAADRLLYVGIAIEPKIRWREHRMQKAWWIDVTKKEVELFPTRANAADAEAEAVATEHPLYNRLLRAPGSRRTIMTSQETADAERRRVALMEKRRTKGKETTR